MYENAKLVNIQRDRRLCCKENYLSKEILPKTEFQFKKVRKYSEKENQNTTKKNECAHFKNEMMHKEKKLQEINDYQKINLYLQDDSLWVFL